MKLIGKQIVVELPEKMKDYDCDREHAPWGNADDSFEEGCRVGFVDGFTAALTEVARMNPAWEVDTTGIKNVIEDWLSCGESRLTPDDVKEIAHALAANPSAWMKRKDVK